MRRQKCTQSINICKPVTDGRVIDSASDIANCLNNYFVKVRSNSIQGFGGIYSSLLEYMPMRSYKKLKFDLVTEDEVRCIVSKLKNTCAGHDSIPKFIFKNSVEKLLPVITDTCNRSFESGIFPKDPSVAKFICVFKSGERHDPGS